MPLPNERKWYGSPKDSTVTHHRVPFGNVEVSRDSQIAARDGHLGNLQDLTTASGVPQVTHLLFHAGHLWRHTQVAIPTSAVNFFDDDPSIQLKSPSRRSRLWQRAFRKVAQAHRNEQL